MDKYLQEIENAVQKAGIDGALTKEAVAQFHGVLEKCDELTEKNKSQEKQLSSVRNDLGACQRDLGIAQGLNKIAAEMEAAIINREQEMTKLEVRTECAEKRVEDHQNMVGLIFRNSVIRSSVLGQELVAIPGTPDLVDQYGVRQYGSGREPDVTGVPVSKTGEEEEQ